MATFGLRHSCSLLLSGFLIAAAGTVYAQEPIVVAFNGTNISGSFDYLQSHGPTSLDSGKFDFSQSADAHGIAYTATTPSSTVKCQNNTCQTFLINTVANPMQFQLTVTEGGTTNVIALSTSKAMSNNSLPDCTYFTGAGVGTLKQTVGSTTTTFNITVTECYLAKSEPVHVVPSPGPCGCEYAAPVTYPVYACQPQPACCLSRLFHRRTLRVGCP